MLSFFKKKEPNLEKIKTFCEWFFNNSDSIIESVKNSKDNQEAMMNYLDNVENQLSYVYREGYKGSIEFQYGYNEKISKWELYLYHFNNGFLIKTINLIKYNLLPLICDKWIINIER